MNTPSPTADSADWQMQIRRSPSFASTIWGRGTSQPPRTMFWISATEPVGRIRSSIAACGASACTCTRQVMTRAGSPGFSEGVRHFYGDFVNFYGALRRCPTVFGAIAIDCLRPSVSTSTMGPDAVFATRAEIFNSFSLWSHVAPQVRSRNLDNDVLRRE